MKLTLGSAAVIIAINDADGFTVRHTEGKALLRHKPADECTPHDWRALWATIDAIAPDRIGTHPLPDGGWLEADGTPIVAEEEPARAVFSGPEKMTSRPADGPYRPELADAFRTGARLWLDHRLGLAESVRFEIDETTRVESAADGVLVFPAMYVADAERALMPSEKEEPAASEELPPVLSALGFEPEIGGGGALFASRYFESGWYVWASIQDGGFGMPSETDFCVCAYPPQSIDTDGLSPMYDVRSDADLAATGAYQPPHALARAVMGAIAFCGETLNADELDSLHALGVLPARA